VPPLLVGSTGTRLRDYRVTLSYVGGWVVVPELRGF
jgi:hypothetical protein